MGQKDGHRHTWGMRCADSVPGRDVEAQKWGDVLKVTQQVRGRGRPGPTGLWVLLLSPQPTTLLSTSGCSRPARDVLPRVPHTYHYSNSSR